MRCDQYIGLTKAGNEWFDKHSKGHKIEKSFMCRQAFNPDPLFGRKFKIGKDEYKEVIQMAPWSSGPMYFVCIEHSKNGKVINTMFNWIEDSNVTNEVDYENGKCWV